MRRIPYIEERETLVDHLVVAFVSAFLMLILVAIGPLVVVMQGGMEILVIYGTIHIWGAVLVGGAFVLGLILGPRRMAEMWGHFWGTEEPENQWLSLTLWVTVFFIVFGTYFLTN